MTLKYAIYFILPPIVLYILALLCAPVLTLAAEIVVERDLSHDTAVGMMAWVIATSTAVSVMVHWITRSPWVTLATGTAAFLLVGTLVYLPWHKGF